MKTLLVSIVATFGFIVACATHAQAPAGAPAGTTGQCKDGTWYSGASKKGACRGHKGVKEWYGPTESTAAPTKTAPAIHTTKSEAATPAKTKRTPHETPYGATPSPASTPASAPAGATGLCNDGTYYTGANKKGACRGHMGVKEWYGASGPSKTATTPTTGASHTATPAPATMPPQTFPKSTPTTMPNANTPTTGTQTGARPTLPGGMSPVPGGGAGKVWVNTESKVYHCPGDRYYGTTKQGEYMSEADAIAKGNRAAHGKSCSS